jgi:hypothetical protein
MVASMHCLGAQILEREASDPARVTVAVTLDIHRNLRPGVFAVALGPVEPRENVKATVRWVLEAQDDPEYPWRLIDANQLLTSRPVSERRSAVRPVREPAVDALPCIRAAPLGSHMRWRWRLQLWLVPLVIVGLVQTPVQEAIWILAGAACLGVLSVYLTGQVSLCVSDGMIRRTNWLRRVRAYPTSSLARVVCVRVLLTRFAPSYLWLLFLDSEGRTVFRAYATYYPPRELGLFIAALGLESEFVRETLSAAEVRISYPGSFRWPWAHYWLSVAITLATLFVVSVIVIAVISTITRHTGH